MNVLPLFCVSLLFVTVYGIPCPAIPTPVDLDDAVLKDVVAPLEKFFDQQTVGVLGAVAIVVYGNKTIFFGGYGKRDYFNPNSGPPLSTDLVRIASNTKTFTSALMLAMRDAGIVSVDDPVTRYVPSFSIKSPYPETERPITLRQLASHTSGLPRETPYPCEFNATCVEAQILGLVSEKYLVLPQYKRFHYSNLAFSLLGSALGHAGNQPYEALVQKYILDRLGMGSTFRVDNDTISRMAVGVDDGVRAHVRDLGWDNGCGGLIASSEDMAKYMSAILDGTLLDPSTVNEYLTAVVLNRDGSTGVGLPWELAYRGGMWIKSKQGGLAGYRSSLALVPDLRLGIFTTALQNDVEDGTVWAYPALDILVPRLQAALWQNQPPPESLLPPAATQYVGNYSQGISIFLSSNNNSLIAQSPGGLINLTRFSADHVVRVTLIDENSSCRTLDDGVDQELMYFEVVGDQPATAFIFMDDRYTRK
eukprot:TRINITY_DN8920_c0_g2_i1.p1 TRINITY_DN8920_c0_g2~~TRINITY_DN8920_c0_g2_i1.p1  ORF type:complete len:484 (+),score=62.55 TRINITY_DN8920_c0_g2_i1:22-1452(+)